MNTEINKALSTANVIEKFTSSGYTPEGGTPRRFSEYIHMQFDKWGKVIKAAGIKPQD